MHQGHEFKSRLPSGRAVFIPWALVLFPGALGLQESYFSGDCLMNVRESVVFVQILRGFGNKNGICAKKMKFNLAGMI
jgi:hypothetical protein